MFKFNFIAPEEEGNDQKNSKEESDLPNGSNSRQGKTLTYIKLAGVIKDNLKIF